MATQKYKQIFALSVKLILSFAAKGEQPNLEDFQKHLQAQGITVINLEGELFIIDSYGEAAAKLSPHKSAGYQITEL